MTFVAGRDAETESLGKAVGLENEPWWKDLLGKKDTHSLRDLASEFNTTPGAISLALKMTGTARKPRGESLPPEPTEPARQGSKDRLIEPHLKLLGTVPDAEVARRAGVSVRTIASYRARNQISGYKGRSVPTYRKRRRSRIDPYAEIVGKVPDRVVAEKAGVTLNAVRNYRATRGITSSRQRKKEAREAGVMLDIVGAVTPTTTTEAPEQPPVETPVSEVSVSESSFAWRFLFENEQTGIVTGATLVDAARRVQGHGSVVSVERLGQLL